MSEIPKPQENLESKMARVIGVLKEKGPQDLEAEGALLALIQEAEKQADATSIAHGRIGLDRFRAEVYLQAGYKEEAIESLKAALMQASGEGDPDTWDAIKLKLDELGAEL